MRYLGLILPMFIAGCVSGNLPDPAIAQNLLPNQSGAINLSMPQASTNNMQDRIRAGDLECANAIGSATNLELGVMGVINNGDWYYNDQYLNPFADIGVFARIVIPLGAKPKERIDCNRLFELELQARQMEILKLQEEISALRALQFEE